MQPYKVCGHKTDPAIKAAPCSARRIKKDKAICLVFSPSWNRTDLNRGPIGYEPTALTS